MAEERTPMVAHQQVEWHTHRHCDSSKAIKVKKWAVTQLLDIPTPSQKLLPLINLWTYPPL